MITRDSLGKCLPMVVSLPLGASWEQIGKAMTVNTFNLAAKIALENGEMVIYDRERKEAKITDKEELISIISHD